MSPVFRFSCLLSMKIGGILSGVTCQPSTNKASLAAEPHAQLQYRMQDPDVAPLGLLSMQSTIMEVGWSCVRRSTGVPRAALCQTRYRLCGLLLWLDTSRRVRPPLLSQVSGSSASAVDACSTQWDLAFASELGDLLALRLPTVECGRCRPCDGRNVHYVRTALVVDPHCASGTAPEGRVTLPSRGCGLPRWGIPSCNRPAAKAWAAPL